MNWPITKERYRQLLLKMKRQWLTIVKLRADLETANALLDELLQKEKNKV